MSEFFFKSVNIWQSYKQERGCLMHFARPANTLLKDEESARDNHVLACNFAKYLPIFYSWVTQPAGGPVSVIPRAPIWLSTGLGDRAFAAAAPRAWNSLPDAIRRSPSLAASTVALGRAAKMRPIVTAVAWSLCWSRA